MSGAEVYTEACAACHGADGRGAPAGTGLAVPLPDFTDCALVTAESTANWAGLVRHGGTFLGLSRQMPAFGDALAGDEVAAVLAHVRGLCRDPRWPIGDLNYRRPVFVEKAFPEDELVPRFETESARHARTYGGEIAIEKRIGPRGQVELALPGAIVDPDGGARVAGGGDVGLAYKEAFLVRPDWRTIAAAGIGIELPTGNRRHGVGAGTPVVTPRLLAGQALGPLVLQAEVRAELPGDRARAPRQMRYGLAVQLPLGPYRRSPVPALELQQSQALASDAHAATLLAPTFYLPLSRRGHVAVGVGTQLPVAGTRPFNWHLAAFLLWEYADGPFWAW
jgi:hypothetical protein